MIQLEFSNVKNWLWFLGFLQQFLNLPQVKSALGGSQVELQMEIHGTTMLRIKQAVGVGDYAVWKIICDGKLIGEVSAYYLDEHFFTISGGSKILSAKEKQLLDSSGEYWATPLGSVSLRLSAKDEKMMQRILEALKSSYTDVYPNPIAERYAPLAEVIPMERLGEVIKDMGNL
jgi:hypothetical protein